jgi:hypothetical protein
LRPETAAQFLYRAQKNVVYNRNVMRNKKLKICECIVPHPCGTKKEEKIMPSAFGAIDKNNI